MLLRKPRVQLYVNLFKRSLFSQEREPKTSLYILIWLVAHFYKLVQLLDFNLAKGVSKKYAGLTLRKMQQTSGQIPRMQAVGDKMPSLRGKQLFTEKSALHK
jgi:hypothetical protein